MIRKLKSERTRSSRSLANSKQSWEPKPEGALSIITQDNKVLRHLAQHLAGVQELYS